MEKFKIEQSLFSDFCDSENLKSSKTAGAVVFAKLYKDHSEGSGGALTTKS